MLRISGFYDNNCTNGDGWRSVVFFSGCPHQCKDCQNPDTWDFDHGYDISVNGLTEHVLYNVPLIDGITLSGGEPFQERHIEEILQFLSNVKAEGLNVWCYTGYRFEELKSDERFIPLLKEIDVLVDGPFEKELFEPDLRFRGSTNQRIIEVQKSLSEEKLVLHSV